MEVPIINDDRWSPTLEFKIKLSEPQDCTFGLYLQTCRVEVFTDDAFPTNKYAAQLALGGDSVEEISRLMLFFEFVKYTICCPGIAWRTVLTLVLDQLANLYLFFTLSARAYLVNVVFSREADKDELIIPSREACTWVIGIMHVVPVLFIQLWKCKKVSMDIEGRTTAMLQGHLLRKYLNYNEESRAKESEADMQVAIMTKCRDVAAAYTTVLGMLQVAGRLVFLVVFTFTHDPSSWWVLVVMPTLMSPLVIAVATRCQKLESVQDL